MSSTRRMTKRRLSRLTSPFIIVLVAFVLVTVATLGFLMETEPASERSFSVGLTAQEQSVLPGWLVPGFTTAGLIITLLLAATALLRWRIRRRTLQLRESNKRLQHLLDSSPAVLYTLATSDLEPRWVSSNVQRIMGFQPHQVLEEGWWRRHVHPDDLEAVEKENTAIFNKGHQVQEYRIFDANGKVRYVRDERRYSPARDGSPESIIGSWTDLTSSYEQEEKLRFLTHYDTRTGLPNRTLLQSRIEEAITRAKRRNSSFLVILVDLDRFKTLNETLGMKAGDEILTKLTERLSALLGPRDTLARVGSDEFCLVMETGAGAVNHKEIPDRVLATFRKPLTIMEHSLVLTASIGIATFPQDGTSNEQLIAGAELAIERAKKAGGDTWHRYESGLGESGTRRLFLERDLRHAISHQEFLLFYQPQFCLKDQRLIATEALIRWDQSDRGMVSPGEFIPLAEETGLIHKIDHWVMAEGCRQMAEWKKAGHHVPRVSINLSTRTFHDQNLVQRIMELVQKYRIGTDQLELEITETMLMEAPEQALNVLRRLDAMGVRLSMDDFGTGYSNLAYLRQLPLHQLKIDRSLIQDATESHHNRSIIRAIVGLARALELELVAEGIETEQQKELLRQEGCDIGQGFLLARPGPPEQMFPALTDKA